MAAYIAEGVLISEGMQDRIIEAVKEVTADYRKKKELEQITASSEDVEVIRLSVEVVSLMNRYGYKLKDVDLLEVVALCSKVSDNKKEVSK